MNYFKKLTHYISEIDEFIYSFDETHPKRSVSQEKEIAKAKRISSMRDHADRVEEIPGGWEGF